MLAVSACFLIAYLIILPVRGQLTDEGVAECQEQTPYVTHNTDSVTVSLYYDVDKEALDFEFVQSMCKAYKSISHATFEFYPGVSTDVNKNGELECYHKDKNNTDCTDSYAAACASKLVDDFTLYVCCTADGGSACDCLKEQNPENEEEFNTCTQLQDPNIKPDQILLDNANAAKTVDPAFECFPIMAFNGVNDPCARFTFATDPIGVLCGMLTENIDDGCPNQN